MNSRRWLPLLIVLLQLLPAIAAHHYEDPDTGPSVPLPVSSPESPVPIPKDARPPTENDTRNNTSTHVALADSVRDQALDAQKRALGILNETLAKQGVSTQMLPADNANVLTDEVDPGTRVGGIGEWRVLRDAGWGAKPGGGWNGTWGFATANLTKGTYGKGASVLLSPALDLSAYPLKTGTLPFANAGIDLGGTVAPFCPVVLGNVPNPQQRVPQAPWLTNDTCVFASPDGRPLQDQINLFIRHHMNVPDGKDGGQVRVFIEEPDASSIVSDMGDLVSPVRSYGAYGQTRAFSQDAGLNPGPGYTGWIPWETDVFDLTRYAGRTIWIGFVFAAPSASVPLSYPDPSQPGGWFVDDVEVRAPAFAHDLKLWGIQGPTVRERPEDPYPLVAPGSNVTFVPVVLNAGANAAWARLEVTVDLPGSEPVFQQFDKNLSPGETWTESVSVDVPHAEGQTFTVSAQVAFGGSQSDPTADNNVVERTYAIKTVRDVRLEVDASQTRVDVGGEETATLIVKNLGNTQAALFLNASLTLPPAPNGTRETDDLKLAGNWTILVLDLAPGETSATSVPVPTSARGRYDVDAWAWGFATWKHESAPYFVHASPPPVYATGGLAPVDREGWNWTPVTVQTPSDDWAWSTVVAALANGLPEPALVAGPTFCSELVADRVDSDACVPDAMADQKFDHLRLRLRYASNWGSAPENGTVSITYPAPVMSFGLTTFPLADTPTKEEAVWQWTLPVGGNTPLEKDLVYNASMTLDVAVRANDSPFMQATREVPRAQVNGSNSYVDAWSLQGLEVRVTPPHNKGPAAFYVDDLLVTGVPFGGDESQRMRLIHVTGGPGDRNVKGTEPDCKGVPISCWTRVRPGVPESWTPEYRPHWSNAPEAGDLFAYGSKDEPYATIPLILLGSNEREVLTSPTITLKDAEDPVLTLNHSYFSRSYVYDGKAFIFGVDFVQVQYLKDDGQWSDFVRLVPEGGYPSVLDVSLNGTPLPPSPDFYSNNNMRGSYGVSADGFYYPAPCDVQELILAPSCDLGGYSGDKVDGKLVWREFAPSPHAELSMFRLHNQSGLENVDFANRQIRLAFRPPVTNSTAAAYWLLRSLRITPFPDFAVDGAIADFHLDTPYDWRAIGVGPSTKVFANVTVENRGMYPQAFAVRLNVTGPKEEDSAGPVGTGVLAPGARKTVRIAWDVPAEEGLNYTLRARVEPKEAETRDEFVENDIATLGADPADPLVAQTRLGFAMDATMVPDEGPAGFARHVFVRLTNTGNAEVKSLNVTRSILRMAPTGNVPAPDGEPATFFVPDLPVGARDVPVVAPPGASADVLQYTPQELGDYVLNVVATSPDQTQRASVKFGAVAQVYADSFENGLDWKTSDPASWTLGLGPDGTQALAAAGPSRGILAASTNATLESPTLPLADVRSAVLTLLAKYDLEPGYDGARVEVSRQDGSWAPLLPLGADGRPGPYPGGEIAGSNPLAQESFPAATTAMTGDSHDVPGSVDGWAPYSFDLGQVPEFQDFVPIDSVFVPHRAETPLRPIPGQAHASSAPWLQLDPSDPLAKWELRNEGEADELTMDAWWSGQTSTATNLSSLARVFPYESFDDGSDLVATWWEHKPGATAASPQGVGALYDFQLVADLPAFYQTFGGRGSALQFQVHNASLPAEKASTANMGAYWACGSTCGQRAILNAVSLDLINGSTAHTCLTVTQDTCYDMGDLRRFAGNENAARYAGIAWPMLAGTDAPLDGANYTNATLLGEILHLPVAVGAVGIPYNVSSIADCANQQIVLTAAQLGNIFSESPTITTWGQLSANNPCLAGSTLAIKPVIRCDAAGTTFALTDYLNRFPVAGWDKNATQGPLVVGGSVCGEGEVGVADQVSATNGAIGYLGLRDIERVGLAQARVQAPNGQLLPATAAFALNAARNLTAIPRAEGSWSQVTLVDQKCVDCYPIATLTYVLTYSNPGQMPGWSANFTVEQYNAMRDYLRHVIDGDLGGLPAGYAPLPPALHDASAAGIARMLFVSKSGHALATQKDAKILDTRGAWNLVGVKVPASRLRDLPRGQLVLSYAALTPGNPAYPHVEGETTVPAGLQAHATNTGWLVTNVTLRSVALGDDGYETKARWTGDEKEEQGLWILKGWTRLCVLAKDDCPSLGDRLTRPAPWGVEVLPGPDGIDAPMWALRLDGAQGDNVDARVVTPAIDLTKTTGSDVRLDLVHQYRLFFGEQMVPSDTGSWMSKWYQAGVVEAQAFDSATGTWGPWTQVFAPGATPDPAVGPLTRDEGAPYTQVLGPAGQTFARFPREYNESIYTGASPVGNLPNGSYVRHGAGEFSFAFSGASPQDPSLHGFHHTELDLTPFAGHLVRLAFHAWTGVGIARTGEWIVAGATVSGSVLDAGTPRIRVHLATDPSDLRGSFAIADVAIVGVTNTRDVGIRLDEQPTAARSYGTVNVSGSLRNFGPVGRQDLALGVSATSLKTGEPIPLNLSQQVWLDATAGYQHALVLPPLAAAGLDDDSAPFNFSVFTGAPRDDVSIRLQVLGKVGGSYAPVLDDIAARPSRAWKIAVADQERFAVEPPVLAPAYLREPGTVRATTVVRNDGTLPLNLMVGFTAFHDGEGDVIDGIL